MMMMMIITIYIYINNMYKLYTYIGGFTFNQETMRIFHGTSTMGYISNNLIYGVSEHVSFFCTLLHGHFVVGKWWFMNGFRSSPFPDFTYIFVGSLGSLFNERYALSQGTTVFFFTGLEVLKMVELGYSDLGPIPTWSFLS